MTVGPVSVLAIQFSENNFRGEILAELYDLVKSGTVRVIDAVVVAKDQRSVPCTSLVYKLGVAKPARSSSTTSFADQWLVVMDRSWM